MDRDDVLVGRLLTRREAVKLIGIGGAAALPEWNLFARGLQAPSPCVVRPEMTEGPYFLDDTIARSDVRANTSTGAIREGVPLSLAFRLTALASGRCAPLPKAVVHLWQCDAVGIYSGVDDQSVGARDPKDNALRGIQATDGNGTASFTTIYPGWYRGRAVHIHFKVRTQATGEAFEYTSQLFFPEALNDEIHSRAPYASKGRRDTLNERDGIYRRGGEQLVLKPVKSANGYDAAIDIALDLSDAAVGRSDGMGGRGRGPGRGRGGRGSSAR